MGEIFLVVFISGIIFGLIGSFIAKNKGVTQSSGFFFGFFLGPIGLIIVALLNPTSQNFVSSTGYQDGRDLVADRYRLWLTQRYDIQRNESLNRFVVASDSFETLEDALGHADYLESLEEDRRREDAERGARSSRQSALVVGAGLAAMALYFVGSTLVGLVKHRIAISAAEASLEARRGELAKELSTVHLPLIASARMTETDYSKLSIEELNELRFTTAYVGDFPYELAYGI